MKNEGFRNSGGSLGVPDKPQHLALAGPVFVLDDTLIKHTQPKDRASKGDLFICILAHSITIQLPKLLPFQDFLPSCAVPSPGFFLSGKVPRFTQHHLVNSTQEIPLPS